MRRLTPDRLSVHAQNLGDVTVFHCIGPMVLGRDDGLRFAFELHPPVRLAIVELSAVTAIDAAGLGLLVSLRRWARARNKELKLMNLSPAVEDVLELTKLKSAFEVCSPEDMVDLLGLVFEQSELASQDPVPSPAAAAGG